MIFPQRELNSYNATIDRECLPVHVIYRQHPFPADAEAKLRRAVRNAKKPGIVGACLWCGHGYTEYSREIENEHFANVCPNAPEKLKADAKKRLG